MSASHGTTRIEIAAIGMLHIDTAIMMAAIIFLS